MEEFPGVLDPIKDKMLIQGINQYARAAGLGGHPEYIWKTVVDIDEISDEDIELSKLLPNFKTKMPGKGGAYYDDTKLGEASEKFMRMTGLMVRNYKDALYLPMGNLVKAIMEGDIPESDIIFVPDFFISVGKNEKIQKVREIPDWKKEMILSTFIEFQANNQVLVLAASDMDSAFDAYGKSMKEFIQDYFIEVKVGK